MSVQEDIWSFFIMRVIYNFIFVILIIFINLMQKQKSRTDLIDRVV